MWKFSHWMFGLVAASQRLIERRFTRAGMIVGSVLIGAAAIGVDTQQTVTYKVFALALGLLIHVFRSADFRGSVDNLLGGAAVGLAVLAGWYLTGGPLGSAWKEYAEFATQVPSRVQVQSYTFISPMGDSVRYLLSPDNTALINFGVVALTGVIAGSFIYALITKSFRIEWFVSWKDFANHAIGGVLMGIGGVLAMGCTVGQAITGMSTLALGSLLTFFAIVIGAAATMKYQYWRMMQEV